MPGQHLENLFRRYKGEVVDVKTSSGGLYSGRVSEITNDYVCLVDASGRSGEQVFLAFTAIESLTVKTADSRG